MTEIDKVIEEFEIKLRQDFRLFTDQAQADTIANWWAGHMRAEFISLLEERERELLRKILTCYSPDDTVNDYQDKIKDIFNPTK